jgi:hypothetical protein
MRLALSEWWHESHGRIPAPLVGPAELPPVAPPQGLR